MAAVSSVRPAGPADAEAIAAAQLRSWDVHDPELARSARRSGWESTDIARAWRDSMTTDAGHLVLVAVEGTAVVGFVAIAPSEDADLAGAAELVALRVDPEFEGRGHGSRLMAASADMLTQRGTRMLSCWLRADDRRACAFLVGAGWNVDGARRSVMDDAGAQLAQARLITVLLGDPLDRQ